MTGMADALRGAGRWARALLLIGVGVVLGVLVRAGCAPSPAGHAASAPVTGMPAPADSAEAETVWTCSMHPQIRRNEPGQCPICGMNLIPVEGAAATEEEGLRVFKVSEAAARLMEIQTAAVERRFAAAEIRMAGKVAADETRLRTIAAWVPGRLERLYVDFTGIRVEKGDHMVDIYSPELLAAQQELLQAIESARAMEKSDLEVMRRTARDTVGAARDRLRLWGLTADQVSRIEDSGETSDRLTVHAPIGGIVVHKNAREGMYVQTGTPLYTIADLSQVWVMLEAYESDLEWLRYGQGVSVATEAYPGQTFRGRIAFIDPVVNERTRTVRVRVDVPNPDGRLKPDMFVHGLVQATVAAGGRVMAPDLAGKWICPMHPGIVKDAAGACDICGMALVTAEALGYAAVMEHDEARPLVIPASAVLVTGTRAVVYVQLSDRKIPTFEGREIVLGPRAGDYYLVRRGLMEGELVVTRGNFKIDSALQIEARPSMMSPEGGGGGAAHQHHGGHAPAGDAAPAPLETAVPDAFLRQLHPLHEARLRVADALKAGDAEGARKAFGRLGAAVAQVDGGLLVGPPRAVWKELAMLLGNDAVEGAAARTVDDLVRVEQSLDRHARRLEAEFPILHPHGEHGPGAREAHPVEQADMGDMAMPEHAHE